MAWLLDPTRDHGLGGAALQDLGMSLTEREETGLAMALSLDPEPAVKTTVAWAGSYPQVRLEVAGQDLVLLIATHASLDPRDVAGVTRLRRQPVVVAFREADLSIPLRRAAPVWTFDGLVDALGESGQVAYQHFLDQLRADLTPRRATEPPPPLEAAPAQEQASDWSSSSSWATSPLAAAGTAWGSDTAETGSVSDLWVEQEAAAAIPTEEVAPTEPEPEPEPVVRSTTVLPGMGMDTLFEDPASGSQGFGGTETILDLESRSATQRLRSPRNQDVILILTRLQKAVSMYRLYPADHPLVTEAIDDSHTKFKDFHEHHGALEVLVQREGVYLGADLVMPEDGSPSDFSFLLFPEGIRSLTFEPGIGRSEVSDFAEVLSEAGAEEDLLSAMWRRDFGHIQYLTYDQLSPAGLQIVHDPTMARVAKRIRDLALGILGSERRKIDPLAEAIAATVPPNPADRSAWATLPERATDFRQTPEGRKRAAIANALFDPFLGDNLGRAADLVAFVNAQDDYQENREDTENFLGGSLQNALWYGNLDGVLDLLARGTATSSAGELSEGLSNRLGSERSLLLFSRLIQERKETVSATELVTLGQRYLTRLHPSAIPNVCKILGLQVDATVRTVFWRYLTSRWQQLLEAIDPLTIHKNKAVSEEALKILSDGGEAGHAKLRRYMQDLKEGERAARARAIVGVVTGQTDLENQLRTVARYPIRDQRVEAAQGLLAAKDPRAFAPLAKLVVEKEFAKRDSEELSLVLRALALCGGSRAIRPLQDLAARKGGLFGGKDVKRVAEAAQAALQELKKR